jgi:hypothetical protein
MCVNCQNCEAVGKLFADLWKRLVFFHQVVNGFSICTSGSFPYFHDAKKSSNNQPVHCQRHIPYRYDQPPRQNKATDYATENEIQREQGDPSTQGATTRHDPEAHPMEAKRQPAEYPEPYIVKLSVLHAGGFEDTIQTGSTLLKKNALIASLLVIGKTSFRSSIIQDAGSCAQRLSKKFIPVHAAAVVPVPLQRSAAHPHSA